MMRGLVMRKSHRLITVLLHIGLVLRHLCAALSSSPVSLAPVNRLPSQIGSRTSNAEKHIEQVNVTGRLKSTQA